jgi:adenosylcobinamide-GDP ribazoletransferase
MKKEINIFFTALMFYTRIPCPNWIDHSPDYLNQATRYFPLIGWIVGLAAAATIYLLSFVFTPLICIIFSLIISILITGAFHEDGLADVCDGFGGGWTREKILEIMKDSRVGAFGVIGLLLAFMLKIAALTALLENNLWFCLKTVVLAHVSSRFMAVTVIFTHQYAREDATAKAKPIAQELSLNNFLISAVWLIPAFLWFENYWILAVLVPMYSMKIYLAHFFHRWLGGYTGDCLGATQQITEIVCLLACLAIGNLMK